MKLTSKEIARIIEEEIIVDCYHQEEENTGWEIYMQDHLHFSFEAECRLKGKSGKTRWERVEVIGIANEDYGFNGKCLYLEVALKNYDLVVPAAVGNLRKMKADEETMVALQVWAKRTNWRAEN